MVTYYRFEINLLKCFPSLLILGKASRVNFWWLFSRSAIKKLRKNTATLIFNNSGDNDDNNENSKDNNNGNDKDNDNDNDNDNNNDVNYIAPFLQGSKSMLTLLK